MYCTKHCICKYNIQIDNDLTYSVFPKNCIKKNVHVVGINYIFSLHRFNVHNFTLRLLIVVVLYNDVYKCDFEVRNYITIVKCVDHVITKLALHQYVLFIHLKMKGEILVKFS